jgi:tetratricopeptide (TPR) repeat protein
MKGQLSEGVLPGLLRDLYVGRQTGTLRCVRNDERRNVRFRRGHIVNADTNVRGKQLGEVMVEQTWISPDEFARATATVKASGRRLGEVLIEMGALTHERLEDALALHIRDIVARVFSWTEGSYEFEPEPDTPGQELTLKLSTGELILEAVRQVGDPDVIRYSLGDLDRVLRPSSDPLLRFQKVALSPADGFVLSRVDGPISAREVMQMIPLPVEETQKSLFGLLCTGIIEYPPDGAKKAKPAAVEPARPVGAAAPPRTQSSSPPTRSSPPPPPAVGSPSAPASQAVPATSPAMDGRRNEIADAFEGLKTRNFFQVLGIEPSASEQQVKEAYFRLARRFHPDTHHDATLSDLADQLEAVFIRLGEAYETLKNRGQRADYEARLSRERARMEAATGGAPGVPLPAAQAGSALSAAATDPEEDRKAAEDAVRKGAYLFEKEKYYDAIQLLEPAIEVLTGKVQARGRLVLAKAYLKNPNWVKRAEETLLSIVHDDGKNVDRTLDPMRTDAYYLLGTIYRERGLMSRATSMFRRVLELKPDHEEALAEVGPPAVEEEPAPEKGGFFKRFRKS